MICKGELGGRVFSNHSEKKNADHQRNRNKTNKELINIKSERQKTWDENERIITAATGGGRPQNQRCSAEQAVGGSRGLKSPKRLKGAKIKHKVSESFHTEIKNAS